MSPVLNFMNHSFTVLSLEASLPKAMAIFCVASDARCPSFNSYVLPRGESHVLSPFEAPCKHRENYKSYI